MFCYWQNNSIVVSRSDLLCSNLPESFHDFNIVQISDLHNKRFGPQLIEHIIALEPDIIVITGDLIDRRRFDLDSALAFIEEAADIAPIYYVSGNHEAWSGKFEQIKQQLLAYGVHVLDDEFVTILEHDASITLYGLSDPAFLTSSYIDGTNLSNVIEHLENWSDDEGFKILLSHRPEFFDLYVDHHMDLVFTGHAHGGQIRLPFVGGLIAPNQGWFPKVTSGAFTDGETTMYVSRGLGNSAFPLRLFNRPEIVSVTLKTKE
ncbi:MAG TPA: phosphoesterase [Firmicutes bacterium]|nr:phosphoesterase [Bacillota bacterium]